MGTFYLIGAVLLGTLGLIGQAVHNHEDPAAGTKGMMAMMNDPIHQTAMTVFVLPELTPELGLSAQQSTDLRKWKQELVDKTKDMAQDAKNKELDATFAKMKAALTDEQRTKLAAMKPMDLHQLAMTRVAMPEHMTMSGFSGSDMPRGGMTKKKGMPQH